jgi:hypothetical protein
MKRSASLSWLLERSNPWLTWWQELVLNWAASWGSVGSLVVISADGQESCEWDLPTDLELKRLELEGLLDVPAGER